MPSVPLCFKNNHAQQKPEAAEFDASYRKNLEVLGYGE